MGRQAKRPRGRKLHSRTARCAGCTATPASASRWLPRSPAPSLPHRAPAATAVDAADSGAGLQEVVVTARKVAENLQDVPISIDVFTKQDMQNLGIIAH